MGFPMRRYLPFIIVAAVALITIASGAMLYRTKRPSILTITKDRTSGAESGESAHILGSPNAPVTLEEFGDFQCPPCGALSSPINQLEHDYRPRLRVIFRHFPLANHAHAQEAAMAAEAAGMQGRFWQMHDLLYREQPIWTKATDVSELFNSYARLLGLNIEQFKKDRESDKTKERVRSDQRQAVALGVQNTPTIFLNNRALPPNQLNPASLRAVVDEAIKKEPSK
jgi:protein-disulfide isomerase